MSNIAQLTDAATINTFMKAGKATFTIVSNATGKHFTYRVTRAKGDDEQRPWFVGVLTGPDNNADYSYLGVLFPRPDGSVVFRDDKKLSIGKDAPSRKGFKWFLRFNRSEAHAGYVLNQMQFLHAGCCGRCGRKLTDPVSISIGLGPICRGEA